MQVVDALNRVEAMDADDVMGSYDLWGTGKYKGFEIAKDVPRNPEEEAAGSAGGAAVTLKITSVRSRSFTLPI